PGSGRDRLAKALEALCQVAERYLPLLLSSDAILHRPSGGRSATSLVDPLTRLISDGIADRTLAPARDPNEVGEALFNATCWPYVHLRSRHGWRAGRARLRVLGLVLHGVERRQGRSANGSWTSRPGLPPRALP